jgi:hypothetical protein
MAACNRIQEPTSNQAVPPLNVTENRSSKNNINKNRKQLGMWRIITGVGE